MIDKTSFKDQAYNLLKESIILHKIENDKIYSLQWFADYLNVSRTPVREAILQLAQENFVEVLPNRGVKIKHITREEIKNICQMRAAIESYCCSYLTRNRNKNDAVRLIDHLSELIEANKQNADDMEQFALVDTQFHVKIVEFSGNAQFFTIHENMRARINLFSTNILQRANRWKEASQEHQFILDAIISGNAPAAYLASEQHIDIIYERLMNSNIVTNYFF